MVTEKKKQRQKAVALAYDPAEHTAPMAVAGGVGETAARIIALAREHGIPIHEDADLVEVLSKLNIPGQIPPETYLVVAEILAFIYRSNASYRSGS